MVRGVAAKVDARFFSDDAATSDAPAGLLDYSLPSAAGDVDIEGLTRAVGEAEARLSLGTGLGRHLRRWGSARRLPGFLAGARRMWGPSRSDYRFSSRAEAGTSACVRDF